jgi:hypothetical protein
MFFWREDEVASIPVQPFEFRNVNVEYDKGTIRRSWTIAKMELFNVSICIYLHSSRMTLGYY